MMVDAIRVNRIPGETRVALMDGEVLVELAIQRTLGKANVGAIFVGRIIEVVDALDAAFVDIGLDRPAFLSASDAAIATSARRPQIKECVQEGQSVTVQISRVSVDDKGPRVTRRPTIAGRHLIYTPTQQDIRFSRRIDDPDAQERIIEALEALDVDGGCIVRTRAFSVEPEVLCAEAMRLVSAWGEIKSRTEAATVPSEIRAAEEICFQKLLDIADQDLRQILVDDAVFSAELRKRCAETLPDLVDRIEVHTDPTPIFEGCEIEAQIDAALTPQVNLPGGGNIVVEETSALTAIDINTGGGSGRRGAEEFVTRCNINAAQAIAHQLRLRNLGGQFVIDFVNMRERKSRERVAHELAEATAGDPSECYVGGFSRLGMLEMTRRRRGESLAHQLCGPAVSKIDRPALKSATSRAFDFMRALRSEARHTGSSRFMAKLSPQVLALIQGDLAPDYLAVRRAIGEVELRSSPEFENIGFEIAVVQGRSVIS
jgi:ribonuclease G